MSRAFSDNDLGEISFVPIDEYDENDEIFQETKIKKKDYESGMIISSKTEDGETTKKIVLLKENQIEETTVLYLNHIASYEIIFRIRKEKIEIPKTLREPEEKKTENNLFSKFFSDSKHLKKTSQLGTMTSEEFDSIRTSDVEILIDGLGYLIFNF